MESTLPPPFMVGDHPAIDFLNSVASPVGSPVEWLGNGGDLVAWLEQAHLIGAATARQFRGEADALGTLDAVAEQARSLRGWWREFVQRHAGRTLDPSAATELEPLNRLLGRDEIYRQVAVTTASGLPSFAWQDHRRWTSPERLLQPIAEALGDLVVAADFRLVRACEGRGCTLMFLDRTKGHQRRWCSMAVCGNRAKAAAHRARQRQATSPPS
jgi:predicted RNA-binding Zn ribbon-like protein